MKNRYFMVLMVLIAGLLGIRFITSNTASHLAMADTESMEKEIPANAASAIFAGGCFWCTESDFEKVPGVIAAISGYTGGHVKNPTYEEVSSGSTGHVESVKVFYDPSKISYSELLDQFWRHVDPTDKGGQFVDRGSQYRSVIFYANEKELEAIKMSKEKLEKSGVFTKPIVTDILPAGPFYPAEEYHQDYYKKNSLKYWFYRSQSGRDQFIEKTWGKEGSDMKSSDMKSGMKSDMKSSIESDMKSGMKPNIESDMNSETKMDKMDSKNMPDKKMEDMNSPEKDGKMEMGSKAMKNDTTMNMNKEKSYMKPDDASLKKRLTPLQYDVVRNNGTEPPFENSYWDNHEKGIYVDIASGEPLFSSNDKFDSGTGWPSFTRVLEPQNVIQKEDRSFFMTRTEVRSRYGDSHLGHLFDDGPQPTGLRYCINSAAIRFVAAKDLEKEGYGEYVGTFK